MCTFDHFRRSSSHRKWWKPNEWLSHNKVQIIFHLFSGCWLVVLLLAVLLVLNWWMNACATVWMELANMSNKSKTHKRYINSFPWSIQATRLTSDYNIQQHVTLVFFIVYHMKKGHKKYYLIATINHILTVNVVI